MTKRVAYLDCFSGISGDMFLGALVDTGVPGALLEQTVSALDVGARLEVSPTIRGGIRASKVDVWVRGEKDMPREQYWSQTTRGHAPSHERSHEHEHAHQHVQEAEVARSHRGLAEIRGIIERAPIDKRAQSMATAIFEALGAAEAKIHGIPVEDVHFHEVGAVDAIVDIVCASVGARFLEVDEWISSPVNVGGGTVHCAHGTFPVPAPATVELLKEAPVFSSGINAELVTPTGAAIVKVLVSRFSALPAMKIHSSGYGAGSRVLDQQPNVLRLLVGETMEAGIATTPSTIASSEEAVVVLEANLDDLNPQVFGYVVDRVLEAGALDVFSTAVQMKKNRPGVLLTVLCRARDADRLRKLLFTETTTLGIRMREERRQVLARRIVVVNTPWGEVRMKVANLNGAVANFAPEYEDCRRIAADRQIPLKQVMQEATRLYLESVEAGNLAKHDG